MSEVNPFKALEESYHKVLFLCKSAADHAEVLGQQINRLEEAYLALVKEYREVMSDDRSPE